MVSRPIAPRLRASLLAALAAPLLASCGANDFTPHQTVRGEARLAKELAGRTAGQPVDCLPNHRSNGLEVIDRDTLLFRYGSTIYRQDTNGQCYPSDSQMGYALVTRSIGTGQLCDGDIAQVVDTSSGFFSGSCSFNAFIPYRRPG